MGDLSFKSVDNSLLLAVKKAAVDSNLTQRDFVIKALTVAVGWEKAKEVSVPVLEPEIPQKLKTTIPASPPPMTSGLDRFSAAIAERQIKKGACPRCEKDLVPWGPKDWHCMSCGRNFMPGEVV